MRVQWEPCHPGTQPSLHLIGTQRVPNKQCLTACPPNRNPGHPKGTCKTNGGNPGTQRTPSEYPSDVVGTHSEPEESSSAVPVRMLMAMGVRPLSCSWRLCRGRGTGRAPPSLPDEAAVQAGGGGGSPGRWALPRSLMGGRHFFFRIPAGATSPMGGEARFGGPTPAMAAHTFVGVGQGQQQGVPGECLAVGPGGATPGVSLAPGWLHLQPLATSWSLTLTRCCHKLPWPVWAPRRHQGLTCEEGRKQAGTGRMRDPSPSSLGAPIST